MKRLHVFRSGTHSTAGGRELYFSEEDVHTSAAVYDPGVCKAPLVIGHPEGGSAPSFGHAAPGLSPRRRSHHVVVEIEQVDQRSISAWAESSRRTRRPALPPGVYLRVGGVISLIGEPPCPTPGLSPRERSHRSLA